VRAFRIGWSVVYRAGRFKAAEIPRRHGVPGIDVHEPSRLSRAHALTTLDHRGFHLGAVGIAQRPKLLRLGHGEDPKLYGLSAHAR